MSQIPPEVVERLRALANEPPVTASELNAALECVRAVSPDFDFTGIGTSRGASLTLPDGTRVQITGRTHGDLLSKAAGLLAGRPAEREERRRPGEP